MENRRAEPVTSSALDRKHTDEGKEEQMIIGSITVRHFRCIKNETLNCGELTALVGANGTGKSTFLRALSTFYDPSPKIEKRDWYNEDQSVPIEIAVTFDDLGHAERQRFSKYIDRDQLTVERVFVLTANNRIEMRYHGSKQTNPEFKTVRSANTAPEVRRAYKALGESARYDLPQLTTREEIFEALDDWETTHASECQRARDDGQFFGFKEVALGYLGEFTRHIYVPAVRDAAADADESKDSAVKEIVDLVVRNALAAHRNIVALKTETRKRYEQILQPQNLSGLAKLENELTDTLGEYVKGAKVKLNWLPPRDVQLELPKTDVTLYEDGYASSVSRTGHGLQRAFILTLLQHLAITPNVAEEVGASSVPSEPPVPPVMGQDDGPNLVLCVEEPEVYQHPSRQRHFSTVLRNLARGTIQGVAKKTQVLYSTHSPLFVGLDRFDQVRLLRKVEGELDEPKCSLVTETTLSNVAARLRLSTNTDGPQFTAETLLPRLQTIMTPWMNEGFFADLVVLVEGEDDVAAIRGTALSRDEASTDTTSRLFPASGKTISIDQR